MAAIVNSIWNNIILFREVKISFLKLNWRRHLRGTRVIYISSLVYGITLMLDNVLLRMVSSAAVVGIYAFSVKIVRTASLVLTDSLTVFFPRIVALKNEGNENRMGQVMQKNLHLLIFFAVPASMGIGLFATPVIRFFLGARFEEAIRPVQILSVFPLLKCMGLFFCNQVLIAHNREDKALVSLLAGNLLFIPLTLLLSRNLGYNGAAIALIVAELIVFLCAWRFTILNFSSIQLKFAGALLHALLSAILFIPVAYFLTVSSLAASIQLLIAVPLCATLYICMQLFVLKNEFADGLRQWFLHTIIRKQGYEQAP